MNNVLERVVTRLFGGKFAFDAAMLKKVNLALSVVLAGQAIAVLFFSTVYELPVRVLLQTGDSLQTQLTGHAVTAPAIHELIRINLAYILAAMLIISAAYCLLNATHWREGYEASLKKKVQSTRWIVTAVCGSLLLVAIGLVAGISDVASLLLLTGTMVLASIAVAAVEINSAARRGKSLSWLTRGPALVAGFLPLLIMVIYVLATNLFGDTGVAGYIYGLVGTVLAGWLLLLLNLCLLNGKQGKWATYLYGECWYLAIFFVLETAVTWELFSAVLHP